MSHDITLGRLGDRGGLARYSYAARGSFVTSDNAARGYKNAARGSFVTSDNAARGYKNAARG